ncbi:MAG: class I SAM-dependent methyltransferase [Alphaproteobacteria bacterium]|nr:class I SAM-dependent methyltransferase [Alphaproteobacteria bacterium]
MTTDPEIPVAETEIAAMPMRRTGEVVRELIPLAGQRVVDVGCGDGGLVRMMAKHGAHVVGIETRESALARAHAVPCVSDERYALGRGEDLPIDAGTMDTVVYLNALHHLDVEDQLPAIAEARRVLRLGGCLLVIEPIAQGPYFELMRPIEDETAVRAAAYAALHRGRECGFEIATELLYRIQQRFAAFEAFAERLLQVDESREQRLAKEAARMRAAFAESAMREEGPDGAHFVFDQPMRANLLRAVTS